MGGKILTGPTFHRHRDTIMLDPSDCESSEDSKMTSDKKDDK